MSPPNDQTRPSYDVRFIAALRRFAEPSENSESVNPRQRAALAILRRGLGKPIGQVTEMYPYVVPYLPPNVKPWQEDAYFQIASLFAFHPKIWGMDGNNQATNLGASFAWLNRVRDSASIEKRFVALLDSSSEGLPDHLRQAISLLRTDVIPVNYLQLLRDIQAWQRDDRAVQRAWARYYWGATAGADTPTGVDETDAPVAKTEEVEE